MQTQDPDVPTGVELTNWSDFAKRRRQIFDSAKATLAGQFPQSYGGVRLELHDLDYADPEDFPIADQKRALLENRFLHRRLRGTWRLFDEKTGDMIEEQSATVMKVPFLTDRGTFLHGGNEIATASQIRLLPGIYARRKANGEIESHVNTRRGTGSSFRVRLEPESGLFKMDIGQSSLRLYSLLRDLGVPDDDLEKRWGKELLAKNASGYDGRVFEKAYQRLVRNPDPKADRATKAQAIKDALAAGRVDREVINRTLPNVFDAKVATAWRDAGISPLSMPVPAPAPEKEKTEFNKEDYLLLAQFLNKQFHAGIPTDIATGDLVEAILESLHDLAPNINPGLLADAIDQTRENR